MRKNHGNCRSDLEDLAFPNHLLREAIKSAAEYVCAREDRSDEKWMSSDIRFKVIDLECGITQAPRETVREWR